LTWGFSMTAGRGSQHGPSTTAASQALDADPDVTLDQRLHRIDSFDLEPVIFTLTHPGPGEPRLSQMRADTDVILYRSFLKLCLLYPRLHVVPTDGIDRVWHAHLLDTRKYRADCDYLFGRFLDHYPYAGLRGEADRRAWQEDFARTCELFGQHFGIELGPSAGACHDHGDGSDCCAEPSGARPSPPRDVAAV